jgi:hypothetical protein
MPPTRTLEERRVGQEKARMREDDLFQQVAVEGIPVRREPVPRMIALN